MAQTHLLPFVTDQAHARPRHRSSDSGHHGLSHFLFSSLFSSLDKAPP